MTPGSTPDAQKQELHRARILLPTPPTATPPAAGLIYPRMPDVRLHLGDAVTILPTLPAASVDAVVTDPPYPEIDRDYGRMSEADWHAMMDVVVAECRRVLKPTGSAVFILQPNSERVGRMRPWLWEFMAKWTREWGMVQDAWWWNYNTLPVGGCPEYGLLRPSLKACVWLGTHDVYRDQSSVLWQESDSNLAQRLGQRATVVGRGMHRSGAHYSKPRMTGAAAVRGGVTPFNVIPMPNNRGGTAIRSHGATTPAGLCDWWVRYICPSGGTVLDPFVGSGTVALAAMKLGRNSIGIERMPKHHATATERVNAAQSALTELLIPA